MAGAAAMDKRIKDSDGARIGIVVKRGSVPCTTARRVLRAAVTVRAMGTGPPEETPQMIGAARSGPRPS